jgi:hypothetical protein
VFMCRHKSGQTGSEVKTVATFRWSKYHAGLVSSQGAKWALPEASRPDR